MSDFDIRQLRAFAALAEHGRVTTVARALGLAQSTVSEALAALDRAVGVPVTIRSSGRGPARLTAAGEALLPHARAILDRLDSAQKAVAESTRTARGHVAIAAGESISTYVLPPALARLRARWPTTRFSVSVEPCAVLMDASLWQPFDLRLFLSTCDGRTGRAAKPGRVVAPGPALERHVLAPSVPLVVFAAPSHRAARSARPIDRTQLAGRRIFMTDGAGHVHALVQRFLQNDRVGPIAIESTGTVEGVKLAVLAHSEAVGLLPAYAVEEDIRQGRIARVPIRPELPPLSMEALLPRSEAQHPAAAELVEMLRAGTGAALRNVS